MSRIMASENKLIFVTGAGVEIWFSDPDSTVLRIYAEIK
jgi:hypothetical protein